MNDEREPYPTWRYRKGEDGQIEDRLFEHPDDVPEGEGWTDDLGSLKDEPQPEKAPEPATESKPKRKGGWPKGKPRKPRTPPAEASEQAPAGL